jgi:hypothetical protein
MTDLKRKSIEPIALASGAAVRKLQEFLAFFPGIMNKLIKHLFENSSTFSTANVQSVFLMPQGI